MISLSCTAVSDSVFQPQKEMNFWCKSLHFDIFRLKLRLYFSPVVELSPSLKSQLRFTQNDRSIRNETTMRLCIAHVSSLFAFCIRTSSWMIYLWKALYVEHHKWHIFLTCCQRPLFLLPEVHYVYKLLLLLDTYWKWKLIIFIIKHLSFHLFPLK